MQLYLLRHAHAVDAAPSDALRKLSNKGRDQAKALGDFLRSRGLIESTVVWHSPLVRARETAEIVIERAKLKARPMEGVGLLPEDNPREILARLAATPAPGVMLVGHEPFMSGLASLLIAGEPLPARFAFRKCALLALEGEGRHWMADWFVSPDIVGDDET
jgi:phosphohistidine phosphatase